MTICFVPLVLWQPKVVDVQTWIEKNNTTLWLNDSPQAMQSFFCPVIGDGGVGKILCISYTHNGLPFVLWCTIPSTKNLTTPSSGSSDQIPSVFDNISIRTVVDGKPAEFCIWDLSYMNEQNLTAFPLSTADVFIICFSLTSRRACLFFFSFTFPSHSLFFFQTQTTNVLMLPWSMNLKMKNEGKGKWKKWEMMMIGDVPSFLPTPSKPNIIKPCNLPAQ